MTKERLFELILKRRSYLCVGLDTDPSLIPKHLASEKDPVFTFNKAIIDATADLCVAYKPNTAFYEAQGVAGWESLHRTVDYISDEHFSIADAKRGHIGNTARQYAIAFFDKLGFDAITVAPYMGHDSVTPFLEHPDKWAILLALTSNPGSQDFQFMAENQEALFERVLLKSQTWKGADRLMFVIGATHPEQFAQVRSLAPNSFFLVPGIGAQGGDLAAISRAGLNRQGGLLVNSSRGIQYASSGLDFAEAARSAALAIQRQMDELLSELVD